MNMQDWFEFEHFYEGELQSLSHQGLMHPSLKQLIDKCVRAIRERDRVFSQMLQAMDVDNRLLEADERVLSQIPDCPAHGPKCRSFQEDWVEHMVKVEEMLNIVTVQNRMTEDHDGP